MVRCARAALSVGVLLSVAVLAACAGTEEATQNTRAAQARTSVSSVEEFTRENWGELVANPEAHVGALVDIVGQVLSAPESDSDGTYWQMYADPENWEWNTVVGYGDPSFVVAENDYVHVTGTVMGEFEGENAFGARVTAVQVLALSAEVVDCVGHRLTSQSHGDAQPKH